jgi:hypothetical protein
MTGSTRPAKPTAAAFDLSSLTWKRSGGDDGSIEVAFAEAVGQEWVLIRVVGGAQEPSVFDHHEWRCFLDGARKGEFDPPR